MKIKQFSKFDPSIPGISRCRKVGKRYSMYVLIDPRDNTVRYVGYSKTKNGEGRKKQHTDPSYDEKNSRMRLWKQELRESGLNPKFKLIDSAEAWEWALVERMYIAYYKKLGDMYNVHPGGSLRKRINLNGQPIDVVLQNLQLKHGTPHPKRMKTSDIESSIAKLNKVDNPICNLQLELLFSELELRRAKSLAQKQQKKIDKALAGKSLPKKKKAKRKSQGKKRVEVLFRRAPVDLRPQTE